MQDADVSGFACHSCSGSMKRLWPGWTAKELKQHLGEQDNANVCELFLRWREDDINYIRENGYNNPNIRVSERNLTKKVLRDKSDDDDDGSDDGDGGDGTLRLLCDQHYSFKTWSTLPDFICVFFGFPPASGGAPPADVALRCGFSPEGGPDSAPSAPRSPPLGVAERKGAAARCLCGRHRAGVATALTA